MDASIFPFVAGDVKEAHGLSADIAWPHTIDDWQFAARVGQGYVARDNGQLVGTCLTWPLDDNVATLGLLIVAPQAGGRGLGRALLRAAMKDHPDRTIVLHATDVAVPLYLSEGFVHDGWVRQFQGIAAQSDGDEAPVGCDWSLRILQRTDYDSIHALDRQATGIDRRTVLAAVLQSAEGIVLCHSGRFAGFALQRRFGRGVVVGPVVGETEQGARLMVERLLNGLSGQFVRLDMVDQQIDATWLSRFGLEEVARVQVMTNGPTPTPAPPWRKFALIGHAFG